jgi:hypothetical protein
VNLFCVGLPRLIEWVRLPGEQHLNRLIDIAQECLKSIKIVEEQGGALVGCKPTRESDGQGIGSQGSPRNFEFGRIFAAASRLSDKSLTNHMDES